VGPPFYRCIVRSVNFIGPKFDPSVDNKLFLDDDTLTPILDQDKTLAHLLARIGKFKSVGDAKRNGWDKPIPSGWVEFTVGKGMNRIDVFIWNPQHTLAESIEEFPDC